ncbi:hypothetical protein A3753_15410 [Sulfitobacter sp. HI0082]|nr:hypothetical protein A3753_15410 [Sulfitobacter sp. HI0082]
MLVALLTVYFQDTYPPGAAHRHIGQHIEAKDSDLQINAGNKVMSFPSLDTEGPQFHPGRHQQERKAVHGGRDPFGTTRGSMGGQAASNSDLKLSAKPIQKKIADICIANPIILCA